MAQFDRMKYDEFPPSLQTPNKRDTETLSTACERWIWGRYRCVATPGKKEELKEFVRIEIQDGFKNYVAQ
jgi:hypothetical protein